MGESTDINIILKDGVYPLWQHVSPELEKLYKKYSDEVSKFGELMVNELQEFINAPRDQEAQNGKTDKGGPSGKDAQSDGRATSDATGATRRNETEQKAAKKPPDKCAVAKPRTAYFAARVIHGLVIAELTAGKPCKSQPRP